MAVLKMDLGYSNSIRNKYFKEIIAPAGGADSDIVLIPYCSNPVSIETEDTTVTIKITGYPVKQDIKLEDIDFSAATWEDWDTAKYISPNITAIKAVTSDSSQKKVIVRCS